MATKLATIIADFRTSLATKIEVGGTTATLQSATDDDGVALPDGEYSFTLNGDNSQKEYIICTLSGTSLTAIKSVTRQGVQSSGTVREHRVGSSVSITNFTHIKYINDLLDGTTDLDADTPLAYDGDPDLTGNDRKLATVKLVEDTAQAGGADASTTVKGITKLSTAPVSPTDPIAVGDNDPRVPTQDENDALQGTSGIPSNSNRYVTDDDTATTSTADKVVRYDGSGDVDVPTTPGGGNKATSKTYVDLVGTNKTKRLASMTSDVTVSNSTTETTLLTGTVSGGDLGTNGFIFGRIHLTDIDFQTTTHTFRLKYGSTTVATATVVRSATLNNFVGYIEFSLNSYGSTGAQTGTIELYVSNNNNDLASTTLDAHDIDGGSSTEDSTGDLSFTITGQSSTANNARFTASAGYANITLGD
jgi:hypothetical protein